MDSIVAIDLGTSHITGVVGEKKTDGTFSIVACETEESNSCIRRGNVYNINETAMRVKNLISKLELKMSGARIEKVYVGVGGQSLRTIEHKEFIEIIDNAAVTDDDIKELDNRCEKFIPGSGLSDVLYIAPAVYYADGHLELNPVGVPCKHLEAKYKIVIGRTSIRRNIINSISENVKIDVAKLVVSPLALADAMLSKEEKELGCALVDFGAGVTTLSVYKNGDLLHMSVIPLGGNLITKDIVSLQLTENEAEKLKKQYGCAVLQKEDEESTISVDMEGSSREIGVNDLNAIVEARVKEIVENVYARISENIDVKALGSGIVLAGCASGLKKLNELMTERFKVRVRYSAIRGGLVNNSDEMLGNPSYMLAISLMLKGSENCISRPFVSEEPYKPESEPAPEPVKEGPKGHKKPKGGLFANLKNKMGDIFDEN